MARKLADVEPENRLTDEELHREIEDHCVGLLRSMAAKWHKRVSFLDRDDLYQEAVLGFYDARRTFDKSRGFQFNTYARHWSARRMFRFLMRETKRRGKRVEFPGEVANRPDRSPAALPDEFWERAEKLLVGRQYEVLSLRYREGLTMRQTAVRMGVGCSRVGQIEEKALERLTRCRELMNMLDEIN